MADAVVFEGRNLYEPRESMRPDRLLRNRTWEVAQQTDQHPMDPVHGTGLIELETRWRYRNMPGWRCARPWRPHRSNRTAEKCAACVGRARTHGVYPERRRTAYDTLET